MELTVKSVYDLLLRSKLLSTDEAGRMFERWRSEAKGDFNDPNRFTSWMIANQYVTEYQASLLGRGHSDCFYLNDYQILDRIGKGRMAGVYRARHRLGQIVAIKILPPSKAKQPTLLARFLRESKLATQLRHPNVVRGYQMGVSNDLHYLVMEHLDGLTLEDVLVSRGRLTPSESVRLVYQALIGLQYLHEQGLVHRDLKPANLMLVPVPKEKSTNDCIVKILDVGLGRAFVSGRNAPPDIGLTVEGAMIGTPDYWAPEQARDARKADIRSDVYSLGCVLYRCLTGQPPFPDTDVISQMIRHATETPRPLREVDPSIPDGLEQILGWMLAKDPAQRYPTPERAAKALEMFLAAGGEEIHLPQPDARLQTYLSWLDLEEKREQIPTEPMLVPIHEEAKSTDRSASSKGKQKSKKNKASPVVSLQTPPPANLEVELVKLDPLPQTVGPTRRELVAFVLGVVSGLLAYAVGRGLASWANQPSSEESE